LNFEELVDIKKEIGKKVGNEFISIEKEAYTVKRNGSIFTIIQDHFVTNKIREKEKNYSLLATETQVVNARPYHSLQIKRGKMIYSILVYDEYFLENEEIYGNMTYYRYNLETKKNTSISNIPDDIKELKDLFIEIVSEKPKFRLYKVL
jgi:hypothetical protein